MKRILALLIGLAWLTATSAFAQSTATPTQTGFLSASGCPHPGQTTCFIQYGPGFNASGQTTLSATGTSSSVALPTGAQTVVVSNAGASTAFVSLGGSTVTAAVSSTPVLPGYPVVLQAGSSTFLAAITAAGTDALTITTGTGIPAPSALAGGAGGPTSNVNVAQVAGSSTVTAGIAGTLGIGGLAASGTAAVGNPLLSGGVFNTSTSVSSGQATALQTSALGAVATAVTAGGGIPVNAASVGATTPSGNNVPAVSEVPHQTALFTPSVTAGSTFTVSGAKNRYVATLTNSDTVDHYLWIINTTTTPTNATLTYGTASGNVVECVKAASGASATIGGSDWPFPYSVGVYLADSTTTCAGPTPTLNLTSTAAVMTLLAK